MVWWVTDFLKRNLKDNKKIGDKHIPKGTSFEDFLKSHIDKVVAKSPAQRKEWYDVRVTYMHEDAKSKEKKGEDGKSKEKKGDK